MDNCCSSIMKYLVFLFNLVFFICGCVIIGFGAYMYTQVNDYYEFFGESYLGAPAVLIAVGVLIAIVTFFGCCGAVSENSCMMLTFSVVMTLVLIAEIGVAIAIFAFKSDALEIITKEMGSTQGKYGEDKDLTKVWDKLQGEFGCCGVSNFTDWKLVKWSEKENVPDSCCLNDVKDCGKGILTNPDPSKSIYTDGCLNKFVDAIESNAVVAGAIGAGLGVVQLIFVVVSFVLGRKMGDQRSYA